MIWEPKLPFGIWRFRGERAVRTGEPVAGASVTGCKNSSSCHRLSRRCCKSVSECGSVGPDKPGTDWRKAQVMYPLKDVYSLNAFNAFQQNIKNGDRSMAKLDETMQTSKEIATNQLWTWEARSYEQLVEYISFLTSMNKRLVLYYRGQTSGHDPLPAIFRPFWLSPSGQKFQLTNNRYIYWNELIQVGKGVTEICRAVGVPRPRTIELIREAQWAIVQHYNLWPTPLLDVTQNLRVAATFALWNNRHEGFLFVFGLPNTTASVSYDVDQHVALARLESVCPPSARRPHIQNGFLVGRYPLYDIRPENDKNASPEINNMSRRLVAGIKLVNEPSSSSQYGSFWDDDFSFR